MIRRVAAAICAVGAMAGIAFDVAMYRRTGQGGWLLAACPFLYSFFWSVRGLTR